MEKEYVGEPAEQLHGHIIDVFHEYRKGMIKFSNEVMNEPDVVIAIDGRILNSIITTAKKRIKDPH